MRTFSYYSWPILVGILLAVLILQYRSSTQNPSIDHSSRTAQSNAIFSYADIVDLALPSVVNIYTRRVIKSQSHPFMRDPQLREFLKRNGIGQKDKIERSLGSGVIVSSDGYILTNNHVISRADSIRVHLLDGRERFAKVIGIDVASDLAVLKINLGNLTPAIFATDAVRTGDVVLAIGNPYGIGQTVTQGIVSATGRHGLRINTYENYIQTDAAINKGNSGGALINAHGHLIGINSVLYSSSGGADGIGFAIPLNTAEFVLKQIVRHGEVTRGWLGVTVEGITPSIAEAFDLSSSHGLILTNIAKGGPADKAGLKPGDIITHIDDLKISDGNASMHQIGQTEPGTKVNVRAIHNGAAQSFLVEIGKRPRGNSS